MRTVSIFRVETVLFSAWGANAAIYTRSQQGLSPERWVVMSKHSDQLCSLFEKIFKWILPGVIDHLWAKGFFLSVFFPSNSFSNNLRNPSQTSREWERRLKKGCIYLQNLASGESVTIRIHETKEALTCLEEPAAKSTQLILLFFSFFPHFSLFQL